METTGMLEIGYVVALVVLLTELMKRQVKRLLGVTDLDPAVPVLTALTLGVVINLANLVLFAGLWEVEAIRAAAREGFLAGGGAMALWSSGKAIVESGITSKVIHR
ncbi:MAG: hypothetical protein ACOY94_19515 [Bacillota bacterium]